MPNESSGLNAPANPHVRTIPGLWTPSPWGEGWGEGDRDVGKSRGSSEKRLLCALSRSARRTELSALRRPMPVRRIWMSGREATADLKEAASSLTAKQTRVKGEGGIPVKDFVTGDVTYLLRFCYGSNLNFAPILPR